MQRSGSWMSLRRPGNWLGAETQRSPPSRKFRARRFLILAAVGVICVGLFLGLTGADVVRLGPSTVSLDPDALVVTGVWYQQADGDPSFDYYRLGVTVGNGQDDPSIVPFAMVVNVSVEHGDLFLGWWPHAGDRSARESVTLRWSDGTPTVAVRAPAGAVQTRSGEGYMTWTVAGERGLVRQPLFQESADFFLETVRVPEGSTLRARVEVSVEWYHVNALQAYPVAVRNGLVTCQYDPPPGTEHSSTYAPCG